MHVGENVSKFIVRIWVCMWAGRVGHVQQCSQVPQRLLMSQEGRKCEVHTASTRAKKVGNVKFTLPADEPGG